MQNFSQRFCFQSLESRVLADGGIGGLLFLGDAATAPQPDFSLVDINPTSATNNQPVSPRDYLGSTSAWYFGYST